MTQGSRCIHVPAKHWLYLDFPVSPHYSFNNRKVTAKYKCTISNPKCPSQFQSISTKEAGWTTGNWHASCRRQNLQVMLIRCLCCHLSKGRVSASRVVLSVKDSRVLSRHLELKQTFPPGYRNAKNTNTWVTWLKPAANMKFEPFAFHLGFQLWWIHLAGFLACS